MRVISGVHKGRRIQAPKNLPVRPTTDRSKEGLFNILQHRLDFKSIQVLDLFAGTGSISYEFSSRGTKHVSAIDQNRSCVQFIKKVSIDLEMKIIAIQEECFRFLEQNSISYDLIFASISTFASKALLTNKNPGSETPGVPASEITEMVIPFVNCSITRGVFLCSLYI